MKAVTLALLVAAVGFAGAFNNINLRNTCPIGAGCKGCLTRSSPDLERCQQLYFYITFASTGNQNEIDRYCRGDCPLILATAEFFCTGTDNTNEFLRSCPSYSYVPTGSFNVQYNASCYSGQLTGSCSHCLGSDNREAMRCLQLFFLATAANHTSQYSSQYCEGNCPSVMSKFAWFCEGSGAGEAAYAFCQQAENNYCGQRSAEFNSQLRTAALNCQSDCNSDDCRIAINEYGCCVRQIIGNTCSNVPLCTLPVRVSTSDFNVNDRCPVASCAQCLARNSDRLERCEQQHIYLAYADTSQNTGLTDQVTNKATNSQDYCSGACPAILSTSNFICSGSLSSSQVATAHAICPSYNVVPSASVDVRASYFRNLTCPISQTCDECIFTQSPEPTRCQQLYSLTFHPNQSDYYLDIYCSSNCPLTLGTSGWYCNSINPEDTFNRCMKINNPSNDYCATLILRDTSAFNTAVSNCQSDCTSSDCSIAIQSYGCCLNMNSVVAERCDIPACSIMTAGAPPLAPTYLSITLLCFLLIFISFY